MTELTKAAREQADRRLAILRGVLTERATAEDRADARKLAQDVYIRVCSDSKWTLSMFDAAMLAGSTLGITSLQLWVKMGITIEMMQEIAEGRHPVCFR